MNNHCLEHLSIWIWFLRSLVRTRIKIGLADYVNKKKLMIFSEKTIILQMWSLLSKHIWVINFIRAMSRD